MPSQVVSIVSFLAKETHINPSDKVGIYSLPQIRMEFIFSQYELIRKLCNYLDETTIYNLSNVNQQSYYSILKPKLNNWDRTLISINKLKNSKFPCKNFIKVKPMGVEVCPVFEKNRLFFIIRSLEFENICKFVKIPNPQIKNFKGFFMLLIISSLHTKTKLPEFWLISSSFRHNQKNCQLYIRFTDLIAPKLFIISDSEKNLAKSLKNMMFDQPSKYTHHFINEINFHTIISHTLHSYWCDDSNLCITSTQHQNHHFPSNQFILSIIDDQYVITCLKHQSIICTNVKNYQSFAFEQVFGPNIVREITTKFFNFRDPSVYGIGNGYVAFLLKQTNKLIVFNVIDLLFQVLDDEVQKVYVVQKGIVKVVDCNSNIKTIDLNQKSKS